MAMMDDALTLAQSICWDEGYGYRHGGHAASHSDGVDCGGLVFHCLNAAGYSVSDTSPGTSNMGSLLTGIGFTEYAYDSSFQLQHGDIVVMNHHDTDPDKSKGHTFFYCENVLHYTDSTGRTNYTSSTGSCKVEASSSRTSGYSYADGDPGTQPGDVNNPAGSGDYPRNGVGAYWEVWCHSYYGAPNYGYTDAETKVYRDPNYTPGDDIFKQLAAMVGSVLLPIMSMGNSMQMIIRRGKRRR